jgi:hypothetical protein
MTEQRAERHPLIARAMDRSLPLEERRRAYREWDAQLTRHWHPGQPPHAHAGGDDYHTHEEHR